MTDIDSFFGSNAKSAKFENIGDTITGTITKVGDPVQRKDYTTGEPMIYKDSGRPQTQLPITVQTELRDDADDDGQRTLWVRGQQKAALAEALKKAGAKLPKVGDWISDRFDSEQPTEINGRRGYPQKIHKIEFRKGADHDSMPVETRAMTAEGVGPAPIGPKTGLPCPAGVNPAKWNSMSRQQQDDMYDALGMTDPTRDFDAPPF